MKKFDLNVGEDFVLTRDGKLRFLVITDKETAGFVAEDGKYVSLSRYNDDLTITLSSGNESQFDVMAVGVMNNTKCTPFFNKEKVDWYWERQTAIELSVADIEKILGHTVKIVK